MDREKMITVVSTRTAIMRHEGVIVRLSPSVPVEITEAMWKACKDKLMEDTATVAKGGSKGIRAKNLIKTQEQKNAAVT